VSRRWSIRCAPQPGGLTYTQTFDAENRLISVTVSGQTTQFVYDGDGNLVKKIKPDGSKTIYPSTTLRAGVGGIYEVDKTSGGSVTRTVTYYPAAGAMRIDSTLYYILKDHLGSASVVTNASGIEVGTQRYYPFGETRLTTGTIYTDKLFTGQREHLGMRPIVCASPIQAAVQTIPPKENPLLQRVLFRYYFGFILRAGNFFSFRETKNNRVYYKSMGNKLCPKIILEGTRLTFKTEIAFELNEHPRIVGPRNYLPTPRTCYPVVFKSQKIPKLLSASP